MSYSRIDVICLPYVGYYSEHDPHNRLHQQEIWLLPQKLKFPRISICRSYATRRSKELTFNFCAVGRWIGHWVAIRCQAVTMLSFYRDCAQQCIRHQLIVQYNMLYFVVACCIVTVHKPIVDICRCESYRRHLKEGKEAGSVNYRVSFLRKFFREEKQVLHCCWIYDITNDTQ